MYELLKGENWTLFQKVLSKWIVFSFVIFFVCNGYIIEIFKWDPKVISPYQLTTTIFNMNFDLILKGLKKDWILSSQRLH
jgi:hypothetical protein